MQIDWHLTVLLVLMLLGAIVAVETRDLLSAVIAVGVVGFATSVGFLILGAPDLAITQVVVEVICLVVLIRATVVRDETVVYRYRDTFAVGAGLVALGVMLVACLAIYAQGGKGRGLPPFGRPVSMEPYYDLEKAREKGAAVVRGVSRQYVDESWAIHKDQEKGAVGRYYHPKSEGIHVPNRVTAVVLDYRAYDTLGEATVILAAIVGALVILRKKGRVEGRA